MSSSPSSSSRRTTRRRGRHVAQQRRKQYWPWIIGGIVAVVVALVIVRTRSPVDTIPGVVTLAVPERSHSPEPQTYAQTPPVGGVHNPTWQNCGIYDQPIPNEMAVHSLEHGAAWITYRPDLPASDIEQLHSMVRGASFTLLSSYPDLPAPVVASAWGVQLTVDSVMDPRIASFLAKYRQGPQTPEPGAPCVGGVGVPDGR